MVLIQKIDKNKFKQNHPLYIYSGSGVPFTSLNTREIYLSKKGGMIDFGQIINLFKDNKDLIDSSVSAVGNISSAVKSISDTVKTSKELEKLQEVKKLKGKNKKKEFVFDDNQINALRTMSGNGFASINVK